MILLCPVQGPWASSLTEEFQYPLICDRGFRYEKLLNKNNNDGL